MTTESSQYLVKVSMIHLIIL